MKSGDHNGHRLFLRLKTAVSFCFSGPEKALSVKNQRFLPALPEGEPSALRTNNYWRSLTSMGVSMGRWNRSTKRRHFTRKA